MGPGQALLNRVPFGKFNRAGREGLLRSGDHLLGLSREVYQGLAAVPWNETGFWGLLKETPTALTILFSKRWTFT
jgi:hypothetical protein